MTRRVALCATCRKCGADGICPECGAKIPRFSAFSDWLRALPYPYSSKRVSLQNLDFIWHTYAEDWLITIEEKQNGGRCPPAQRDTHGVIYQLLMIASETLKLTHGTIMVGIEPNRERRAVEYRGHYVIVFSHTTPDDSEWITVNHRNVTREELMLLLRTGKLAETESA